MRLIVGGIPHETHTFSVEPTTVETLDLFRGDELLAFAGTNHSVGGVIDACRARGIDLVPTFYVGCVSTGTPDRATFEALLGELTARIAAALPADGIVLTLHGAMVAEGYPDAEAEIVRRVRALTGPELPIAVTLDLHANIGPGWSRARPSSRPTTPTPTSTPPTGPARPSISSCGRSRARSGRRWHWSNRRCCRCRRRCSPPGPRSRRSSTARTSWRRAGEALSVTVAGGFPYADVADAGVSVLVVTDNDPEGRAAGPRAGRPGLVDAGADARRQHARRPRRSPRRSPLPTGR